TASRTARAMPVTINTADEGDLRTDMRRDSRRAAVGLRAGLRCVIVGGMKLSDDRITGANFVRSYAAGEVRVGDTVLRRSCLISAAELVTDWRPQSVAELELSDLEAVLALNPEIVILGAGARQRFPKA